MTNLDEHKEGIGGMINPRRYGIERVISVNAIKWIGLTGIFYRSYL